MHWSFIDWGYVPDYGESDKASDLYFYSALGAYAEWAEMLGKDGQAVHAGELRSVVRSAVKKYFDGAKKGGWENVGLHRAALALGQNFFDGKDARECAEFIKRHYLSCFPNDPDAPRLGAPDKADKRIITPYFSHYVFRALWEAGEGDFVLDQYRKCWAGFSIRITLCAKCSIPDGRIATSGRVVPHGNFRGTYWDSSRASMRENTVTDTVASVARSTPHKALYRSPAEERYT